jgi:hypothetical protein
MLKHRYNNLSESISDFDRMLDGMNGVQPLERRVDEDLLDLFRDEQALVRLEQQIEHVHLAIYGSGMPISEAESDGIRKMHAHAAAVYTETAEKLAARLKELESDAEKTITAGRERVAANKIAHAHAALSKFRMHAARHNALAKPNAPAGKTVIDSVNESVAPRAFRGLAVFRRLAGIDEAVQMPRDPGVLGTTRSNAEYEQMAKPFDESSEQDWGPAKIAAHKKKMRGVAQKIHRAGSVIDREYREADEKTEPFAVRPSTKGATEHDGPKEKDPGEKVRFNKSVEFLNGRKSGKVESLSIEDRLRELQEKRTKEQQAAGRSAMADRQGFGTTDLLALRKKGEFSKHHGFYTRSMAYALKTNRAERKKTGNLEPEMNIPGGHPKDDPKNQPRAQGESFSIEDRLRELQEKRTKEQQIKGQEAMMARNFPKKHARWVKDKEAIVAGGDRVSDDERSVPRTLNQPIESYSIEDRLREIRESITKKDQDAGLKKSTIDAAKHLDRQLKKKGAGAEIGTDADARPRINQATTKSATHAKGNVGSVMARASKRAVSREIVGLARYDRLADRADMKDKLDPDDYKDYLRRTLKKGR